VAKPGHELVLQHAVAFGVASEGVVSELDTSRDATEGAVQGEPVVLDKNRLGRPGVAAGPGHELVLQHAVAFGVASEGVVSPAKAEIGSTDT